MSSKQQLKSNTNVGGLGQGDMEIILKIYDGSEVGCSI